MISLLTPPRGPLCVGQMVLPGPINALLVLPDGTLLVATETGILSRYVFDVTGPGAFVCIGALAGHEGPVNHLAIAGSRIATAGDDGTVGIYSADRCEHLASCGGHGHYVRQVALSAEHVASACEDGVVRLFDLDGTLLWARDVHQSAVLGVALHQGHVVSSSADNAIHRTAFDGTPAAPLDDAGGHVVGPRSAFIVVPGEGAKGHPRSGPSLLRSDGSGLWSIASEVVEWSIEGEVERVTALGWDASDATVDRGQRLIAVQGEVLVFEEGVLVGRFPTPERGATAVAASARHVFVGGKDRVLAFRRDDAIQHGHVQFVIQLHRGHDGEVFSSDSSGRFQGWRDGLPTRMLDVPPQPNRSAMGIGPGTLAIPAEYPCRVHFVDGEATTTVTLERADGWTSGAMSVRWVDERWIVGLAGEGLAQIVEGEVQWFDGPARQTSEILPLAPGVVLTAGYFFHPDRPKEPGEFGGFPHITAWSLQTLKPVWYRDSQPQDGEHFASGFLPAFPVRDGVIARSGRGPGEVGLWRPDGTFEALIHLDETTQSYGTAGEVLFVAEAGRLHWEDLDERVRHSCPLPEGRVMAFHANGVAMTAADDLLIACAGRNRGPGFSLVELRSKN